MACRHNRGGVAGPRVGPTTEGSAGGARHKDRCERGSPLFRGAEAGVLLRREEHTRLAAQCGGKTPTEGGLRHLPQCEWLIADPDGSEVEAPPRLEAVGQRGVFRRRGRCAFRIAVFLSLEEQVEECPSVWRSKPQSAPRSVGESPVQISVGACRQRGRRSQGPMDRKRQIKPPARSAGPARRVHAT